MFDVTVNDPLGGTIEEASERTPESSHKDALSNLHNNAQEYAFEFALGGALEVALELHI